MRFATPLHFSFVLLSFFSFIPQKVQAQKLEQSAALEDLHSFAQLLETQSSYYQIASGNVQLEIERLETLWSSQDSIAIHRMAYAFEKIIANLPDRHANIKMSDFEEEDFPAFERFLPFAIAPLGDEIVALKKHPEKKEYIYYLDGFPYLKSINGMEVEELMPRYAYRYKNSPQEAYLFQSTRVLRDFGEALFKQGEALPTEIEVVFTNEKKHKARTIPIATKKQRWHEIATREADLLGLKTMFGEKTDLSKQDKWLPDSIGYLQIPDMFSFEDYPEAIPYLENVMERYRSASALVIDIRNNGGGTREILNFLAPYIVQAEQSPWVANVAYVRSDQMLDEDIESMQFRFLYHYYSDHFLDADRNAIDRLMSDYQLQASFNENRFSTPYYMLLKAGENPLPCPIYILVNERSFSAASVFTSAFKGLPNVTIAGVTTNGSSGRSQKFYLEHSDIRVKLSTMLSFQRNGYPLDGFGTEPDLYLPRSEAQVLGQKDFQLEELLSKIKK